MPNTSPAPAPRPLTEVERHHFTGGLVMLDEIGNYIAQHPELTNGKILNLLADLYIVTLKRTLVK